MLFATIFTPQGDGNTDHDALAFTCFLSFATIFTPQGDGNTYKRQETIGRTAAHSLRYLPRKGTETTQSSQ